MDGKIAMHFHSVRNESLGRTQPTPATLHSVGMQPIEDAFLRNADPCMPYFSTERSKPTACFCGGFYKKNAIRQYKVISTQMTRIKHFGYAQYKIYAVFFHSVRNESLGRTQPPPATLHSVGMQPIETIKNTEKKLGNRDNFSRFENNL